MIANKSGVNRPVLYLLQLVAFVCLMLAVFVAIDEGAAFIKINSKNFNVQQIQKNDLRSSFSTFSINGSLKTCFNSMNSMHALLSDNQTNLTRAQICSELANEILNQNPTIALAWLVAADAQALEGRFQNSVSGLQTSHGIAKREGWLSKARLTVWLKLSDKVALEEQITFLSDVELNFLSRTETIWLARRWKQYDAARPAIELELVRATPRHQRLFLREVKK